MGDLLRGRRVLLEECSVDGHLGTKILESLGELMGHLGDHGVGAASSHHHKCWGGHGRAFLSERSRLRCRAFLVATVVVIKS